MRRCGRSTIGHVALRSSCTRAGGEEMAWRAASKQVAKVIRQMAREDLALAVTEAGVSAMRRLSRHACYVVVARRS